MSELNKMIEEITPEMLAALDADAITKNIDGTTVTTLASDTEDVLVVEEPTIAEQEMTQEVLSTDDTPSAPITSERARDEASLTEPCPTDLFEAAKWFIRAGFYLFPIHLKTVIEEGVVTLEKNPLTKHGFKDATNDENVIIDMLQRRQRNGITSGLALGIDCGRSNIFVLDVDVRNGKTGLVSLENLQDEYSTLPDTWLSRTPSGGLHYWFRGHGRNSASSSDLGDYLDTRGDGGYIVVPPSVADSGDRYEWINPPDIFEMADAPTWLLELTSKPASKHSEVPHTPRESATTIDLVTEGKRNDTLFRQACSYKSKGLSQDEAFGALITWNATHCNPPVENDELGAVIHSAYRSDYTVDEKRVKKLNQAAALNYVETLGTEVMNGAAVKSADEIVFDPENLPKGVSADDGLIDFDIVKYSQPLEKKPNPFILETDEYHLYQFDNMDLDDTGNARRLIEGNKGSILYLPGIGWGAWNERLWVLDAGKKKPATGFVTRLATDAARIPLNYKIPTKGLEGEECESAKRYNAQVESWVRNSKNDPNLNRTLSRASKENDVAFDPRRFDADPFLFQAANCVIDLRTGEARSPKREDYITLASPVKYDEKAQCPRFLDFLYETCQRNEAKMEYLLWMYGYSLVGHNRNTLIFFFIGNGRDGKSTIMRVNREMLGDTMSALTDASLLYVSTNPKHARNELASFANKHLVVFSESGAQSRLDEDLVKRITGENNARVEAKFQEAEELPIRYHGVLLSQHKPNIYGQDRALWRRLRMVKFHHEYTEDIIDVNFYENILHAELPGVLRLSVETWLKHKDVKGGTDFHLRYPEMVADLEEYRGEMDVFGAFAQDCLLFEPGAFLPDIALRTVAAAWANDTGDRAFQDATPKYIKKVVNDYVITNKIAHPVVNGKQHRVDREDFDIDPGTQNILRGWDGVQLSVTGKGYWKRARANNLRDFMSAHRS